MPMSPTQLVEAANDRGYTFESMGAGKASKRDLTYYVLEIADEEPGISNAVVAVALYRIWEDQPKLKLTGGPNWEQRK